MRLPQGRGGTVCLSAAQADVLDGIADGLRVIATTTVEYGARWGYALALAAADHAHGRAAWLGAAAAIAGREGCDLESHDWWLEWWTHDEASHLQALREGRPHEHILHPFTQEEEGTPRR